MAEPEWEVLKMLFQEFRNSGCGAPEFIRRLEVRFGLFMFLGKRDTYNNYSER